MKRCRSVLCGLLVLIPAVAGAAEHDSSDPREALRDVRRNLERQAGNTRALQRDNQNLEQNIAGLNARLIDSAGNIQELERRIQRLSERLRVLSDREAGDSRSLNDARRHTAVQHAILSRISRAPRGFSLFAPRRAIDLVRTEIALRGAGSYLIDRARENSDRQSELADLRTDIAARRRELEEVSIRLREDRDNLRALLSDKRRLLERGVRKARREVDVLRELENEARTLEDIVARLESLSSVPPPRRRSGDGAKSVIPPQGGVPVRPDNIRGFPVRGHIRMPVTGRIFLGYEPEDPDRADRGVGIRTIPGAVVVAPFDGLITVARHFAHLGRVIMIEHVGKYYTILRGVGEIEVFEGQWVLSGEVLASMPDEGAATAPVLTVELRHGSNPVNPMRWLAENI